MNCCICQEKGKPSLQVHTCRESITCFDCLIKERWNFPGIEAYKTSIEIWWEPEPIKCPICNTYTNFIDPPDVLVDYWEERKKAYMENEYEVMITKLAITESRVAVGESYIEQEKLLSRQWQDKYDELYLAFKKTDAELKNAMRRVIAEVDKNNEIIARYINMKTRTRDALDEDDDEFNAIIQKTTPKKRKRSPSPEYNFVNPDISKSYPLSDLYAENSQSQ